MVRAKTGNGNRPMRTLIRMTERHIRIGIGMDQTVEKNSLIEI